MTEALEVKVNEVEAEAELHLLMPAAALEVEPELHLLTTLTL